MVVNGFHIMLRLARVVCQFPAQYFGKLLAFNLLKLTWLWGVFTLFVGYLLLRRHGNVK